LRQRITETQRLLAQDSADAAVAGPQIEVSLALADGLELPPQLRVFVAARNAVQEGVPPLAAIDLTVGELPTTVTLDNNLAVTPAFNLSSADTVYVTATVSLSGSANVQSGDYRVQSESFAHNGQHSVIELLIGDVVP
jgi:cytochrome c-type biogenesis protein CcmH